MQTANELPAHVHPDDKAEQVASWTNDGEPGFIGEDFFDVLYDGSVPPAVFDGIRTTDFIVDSVAHEADKTAVRFRYDN